METKHTKGEWVIENEFNHTFNVTAGKRGFVIAAVTGDSITHFLDNLDEAEANAKLIAAAPEMLKALQSVIDTLAPHFYKMGAKKAFSELVTLAEVSKVIHNATE